MRPSLILYILFVTLPILAQTDNLKIVGVSEPPELTGAPKKVIKPSDADTELFETIGHLKNEDETRSTLPKLDEFIKSTQTTRMLCFLGRPAMPAF